MPLGMLGKYERIDVLGHGVSGIVYLAKDTLLNKQVALKEVDVQSGDVRRFLEEARVMDRLRHPNIVRVNSVDRIDGKIIIDMEYVRGDNLQNLLRAEGPLPLERALDVASQVLDALEYAHSMQTVHRDIKPANILIGRDGSVKLADFGLAEILATNAYAGGAGTYAYMAPEDFAAEDHSDNQSDIWAVGVTLFEMLTGERPFQVSQARDPFAWKRALEIRAPALLSSYLPGTPSTLQAILDRALARDKRDRYPTAGAFRDDLLKLRAGSEPTSSTLRVSAAAAVLRATTIVERDAPTVSPSPIETTFTARPQQSFEPTVMDRTFQGSAAPVPVEDPSLKKLPLTDPPTVIDGPGLVVAEVGPDNLSETPRRTRRSRPFLGRKTAARMIVEPVQIDFGPVRKGELRSARLQVRVVGGDGEVQGRVLHHPGWLTVHPTIFDRTRQTVTLTAHTARAWETGDFQETVTVETNAGTADIPVRLKVLKPRPSFGQVAPWFVPLFFSVLAPILAVVAGRGAGNTIETLTPSAATAAGMLSTMLLLVCIAADIGIAERAACVFVMIAMCFVLGMSAASQAARPHPEHPLHLLGTGSQGAAAVGFVLGLALLLQLLHLRRWKVWAMTIACLGLLFGGMLLRMVIK